MSRILRSLAGAEGFQRWWRHCARERHGGIHVRRPKVWGKLRPWPGMLPGSRGEKSWASLVRKAIVGRTPTMLWVTALPSARSWRQDSPVHQLGPNEVMHVVGKAQFHRGRHPPAQEL